MVSTNANYMYYDSRLLYKLNVWNKEVNVKYFGHNEGFAEEKTRKPSTNNLNNRNADNKKKNINKRYTTNISSMLN